MFNFFKKLSYKSRLDNTSSNNLDSVSLDNKIKKSLTDNLITMRNKCENTSDFNVRELTIKKVKVAMIVSEGMVNLKALGTMMLDKISLEKFDDNITNEDIYNYFHTKTMNTDDLKDSYDLDEVFKYLMSGFVVFLIDGIDKAIVMGAQGFSFRSISEPSGEVNEKGSREGFTEPLRINMTMIKRRIKDPRLKLEIMTVGSVSKTDICLAYMTNAVSKKLLSEIRHKLTQNNLEVVLTSGYLQPFLESQTATLFSDVGFTERPDTLCAKIQEGRVAIVIDGTPFALIVPYLFTENFQTIDDYSHKPYYATFIRLIKYISFIVSILLPGVYVAVGTFHPELFPDSLLFNIASAQETTPFPLVLEALIIHFMYEIMREAGLRLPRAVGHAVSIVGALVIGDASVSAGLIGSPMILVVALTAISSFVVPSLHEAISVLRFAFIIIGGTLGLYGIALGSAIVLTNACALQAFGVPYLTSIAPFSIFSMRDVFVRRTFKVLQKQTMNIRDLNGVNIDKGEE